MLGPMSRPIAVLAVVLVLVVASCGGEGEGDAGTAGAAADRAVGDAGDGAGAGAGDRAGGVVAGADGASADGAGAESGTGGGDESGDGDNPASAGEPAGPVAGNDDDPPESVASPLGILLGDETYGLDRSSGSEATLVAKQREQQELTAECMAAAGHRYIPIEPAASATGRGAAGTGVAGQETDDGSRAWAAAWGFGVSTTEFAVEEVGPDLIGHERGLAPAARGTDPNTVIMAELSPVELEAYFAALYGEAAAGGDGDGFEAAGCVGQAIQATEAVALEFFAEFADDLDALYSDVEADERLVAAIAGIDECLAGQSLTYGSRREVLTKLDIELSGVLAETSHPAEALDDATLARLSAAEVDELLRLPRTVSAAGLAALGELQQREIELALAVHDCGGGAELVSLRSMVIAEHEQAFIEANEDRLAPYRVG